MLSKLFSLFKKKEAESAKAKEEEVQSFNDSSDSLEISSNDYVCNNSDVITNDADADADADAFDKAEAAILLEVLKLRELQEQQSSESNDFSESSSSSSSSTDYTSNTSASNSDGVTDADITVTNILDDDEAQIIIQKLQKQISDPINYRKITPTEMINSPLINNKDVILYYKTELVRDAKRLKSVLGRINSDCFLDISEDIHYLLCDDIIDIPFIDLCLLQYRFSNLYDFIFDKFDKNKSSFWYVRAINNLNRIDPSMIANGSIYKKPVLSTFLLENSVGELNAKISNAYADLGEMLLFRYVDFPFNAYASYEYFIRALFIRPDNVLAIRSLGSLLYNMAMKLYTPHVYAGGHSLNSQEFKQLFDMSDINSDNIFDMSDINSDNSDNKDMIINYISTQIALDYVKFPLLNKAINILERGMSFHDPSSTGMLADVYASFDIDDDDDKVIRIANTAINLGDQTGCGLAALIKTKLLSPNLSKEDYEHLEHLAHKLISLPNAFPNCKADGYYVLCVCCVNIYHNVKQAIDYLNTSRKLDHSRNNMRKTRYVFSRIEAMIKK